ncbi:hypothetical protein [Flexibacterium corallicola]|uniref:hypothetical protein n=1 Tax=Flexibacterium corallicola TaxID=3037259 RepID=UPI00286F55B8|nr:hypothetical protein [Pseudovibrio sp. M1P-2-3]
MSHFRKLPVIQGAMARVFTPELVFKNTSKFTPPSWVSKNGAPLSTHLTKDGNYASFNFEVERKHTYIAGGMRVHNDCDVSDHILTKAQADLLRSMFGEDQVFIEDLGNGKFIYFLDDEFEVVLSSPV